MKRSSVVFSVSIWFIGCRGTPSQAEPELQVKVHCVSPTRESFDESLELRGHLEPPPGGDLPLASQVAGRIVEVLVHEGQSVKTGEIVATVDDLASRDAVRQSEAALAQASASERASSANLARTRALVGRGIAAGQELEDATAKAETDKQVVAAGQAALDLARRTLGRVQVRSAFSGNVTRVWRGPGAIVDGTASTPIAQVAATAGVEFIADATEGNLRHILPGGASVVTLATDTPSIAGTVRTLSSALDTTTGLGTVRIALTRPPENLIMGTHGRAKIVTEHRSGVLTLPAVALRGAVLDGAEVVVCEANVAKLRNVVVGYRDEQRLEIVSGLADTDRVAIDHVLGLDEGTRLSVVP